MKKGLLLFYFVFAVFANVCAQSHGKLWKVFCSGPCDTETLKIGEPKQNFIDVRETQGKFYWGNDNVYTVYNRSEKHSGFVSTTTYDFVDKYNQRGNLIYVFNRDASVYAKHLFVIVYKGLRNGKFYCSNEPQNY